MGKRKNSQTVGTPAVRAWAAEQAEYRGAKFLTPREGEQHARGRVPNAVIEAYEKATGNTVETGHKAQPMVTLVKRGKDKRGRNTSRKVQVTRARVLELAGETSPRKGVLPRSVIEAAEAALAEQ